MNALEEAQGLRGFLDKLGLFVKKQESPQKAKSKAEDLAESILKGAKLKYHKSVVKKGVDGHAFRYKVEHAGQKYLVKCYVVYESQHFSMTIWSDDGQNMEQVVAVGYLKYIHALKAAAKARISEWMETKEMQEQADE